MSDQTAVRMAGAWLAGAALLLALALGFHGPLHPDLEVQMTHIGESASRGAAVHWTAAAAFTCFAVAAVLVLVSRSRLTSSGKTISAWAIVLVGALWTLTTAVTEVTVIANLAASRDLAQFKAWWSFAEGHGNGFSMLAVAVAVIAWNEYRDRHRLLSEMGGGDRCRSRARIIRRLGARRLARRGPGEPPVAHCIRSDVRIACLAGDDARQNERLRRSGGGLRSTSP